MGVKNANNRDFVFILLSTVYAAGQMEYREITIDICFESAALIETKDSSIPSINPEEVVQVTGLNFSQC